MLNNKLKHLLQILGDGEFHSGADLGETLGVTRSAIWKLIQQLNTLEIDIEAKTNSGYRLVDGLELLDLKKIEQHLPENCHAYLNKTVIFDEITSTNTYLMDAIRKQDHQTMICLAESQTAGRGRFHRTWQSPFGRNIYLSLCWHFTAQFTQLSGLSLVIAIAIIKAIKEYGIVGDFGIKWPNDIYWLDKKIAGILIELQCESHHECYAVIGVGLNLYIPLSSADRIDQPFADLAQIAGQPIKRNKITALLIKHLTNAISIFEKQGLKAFMPDWQQYDYCYGQSVNILNGKSLQQGIARGIDENGQLIIEKSDGSLEHLLSGEVSLRLKKRCID